MLIQNPSLFIRKLHWLKLDDLASMGQTLFISKKLMRDEGYMKLLRVHLQNLIRSLLLSPSWMILLLWAELYS